MLGSVLKLQMIRDVSSHPIVVEDGKVQWD